MAIIAKYKFNQELYADFIPTFNSGFTYTITDSIDTDGYTIRTIESNSLPTLMKFGDVNNRDIEREKSLLEVLECNTQNVTDMSYMFYYCSNLTSLNLSNFNTEKVTNMKYMFFNCEKLTSLNLSSFNTEKVTDMNNMFFGCSSLTALDLSSFNTQNVTNMYSVFYGCSSLTFLDLSSFNTEKVTNMMYMFYGCSSLTFLELSSFNTQNVTDSSRMFNNWTSSQIVYISSKWTLGTNFTPTFIVKLFTNIIAKYKFNQNTYENFIPTFNSGFTSYTISDEIDTDGYTIRTLGNDSGSLPTTMRFGNSSSTDREKSLLEVFECNTSKVTSMSYMFGNCTNLKSVDLSNCNTEKVTSMSYMFYSCSRINSLDLSSFNTQNVTDMRYMFGDCLNLTSLDLSSFNTENVTNMSYMFRNCSNLTSLDLSGFNTQKVTDMTRMFIYCSNLTSLDLSGFNTQNVTDMSYMFSNCSKLTSLDLSGFNTQNVTNTSYMFASWSSSQKVYISSKWTLGTDFKPTFIITFAYKIAKYKFNQTTYENFIPTFNSEFTSYTISDEIDTDGYTIRTLGNDSGSLPTTMIFGNSSGTNREKSLLKVFECNTSKVTSMSYMFGNCSNLTSLDLSSFNTEKVTSMSYMFYSCSRINSLDLSSFNTEKVTSMANMFLYCSNLTSLDLTSFNTEKVTNMTNMFNNCTKLTSLDLTSFDTQKVTSTTNMFNGWKSSQKVYISSRWTLGTSFSPTFILMLAYTIAKYKFNQNTYASFIPTFNTDFTDYAYIDKKDTDGYTIRTIGNDSGDLPTLMRFGADTNTDREKSLLEVLECDTKNVTNMSYMFANCSNLKSLDLSNFNTENVTDMQQMFYYCSELTSLDTSNFNTKKVTNMTNIFQNCSSLTSLDISSWDTSSATNIAGMFNGCGNLIELKLMKSELNDITNVSSMFRKCSSLTSIDLSSLNFNKVTTTQYMFMDCTSLTDIKFNDLSFSNITNCADMFSNCTALTNIDLSSIHITKNIKMNHMFNNCPKLQSIKMFNCDGNVETIHYVFSGCKELKTLDLSNLTIAPNTSVTGMFSSCQELETVDLSNIRDIGDSDGIFTECPKLTTLGLLYSTSNTINTLASKMPSTEQKTIYYYDADPSQLTPIEGVTFKKYTFPTTIQLPPHIQLHSLPDGTRDEVDIKTGILIRRTQKVNNEIIALETPTTEQLILNYNNSCDYGRILPTGVCDKYDVINSMYTQTMASILLDGANTWDAMEEFENTVKFTATGTTVGVENLNMLGAGGLYCDNDLFPNINDDSDVPHCRVDEAGNKFYIYVDKEMLMSLDLFAWQVWLQANKFNMIYELAEHLTYIKPYEELDPTQARWEGMDCMRDGGIKYHTNNSDNITIYPTLEYVAPSINNFEVSMLESNTKYTVYAKGINDNDTINLGGADIHFKNGIVCTSGDNQWLRIDNNDSFYNIVIIKGDTTGEVVPYFEGMTSIENPKVQCGESTVSYTDLILRSLPNGVKDTINVVTGEYIQRVGKREYQDGDLTNENILTDGINTIYELEDYIMTKFDPQTLLACANGTINLSSDTGLLPTIHYTVPSTSTFHLPSIKTGTHYTLKYPSASGSITIGDITYNISSDSMLFTTPLKFNGDTSAIIFSDSNPENVMLIEGAYNKREVPFFTGVKSVKNPNITIIDQLSTKSTTYNCETEIELRGLPNGVTDKLDIIKGKLTTNVGIRPYQEGDENLPNVWTDGYETVYALSSPVVTNVEFETPHVTTNSLIELLSDYLIPQLNYRAPSSNNFPLDLLQPNQTYTLYADTLVSGSYTLGGTKTGIYSQPHTITLGDMTDNLLTFNGDLGLSNVMLVKGNSLKTTLPPYFLGIRSVTDGHLLVEGMAGEINEITFDEGIVLRDCNGTKDTIDLITRTLTKRTGEITLTGVERWSILPNVTINDDLQVFALALPGINSSINNGLICDRFIHKHMSEKSQDTEAIYSTNNQLRLVVKKSRIGGDTVNALKSWLNQNSTTVVYTLITPLKVPLENIWTTLPPTSYNNQTEISSTVSTNSLKPMINVTIATTTLEEIVSNLKAQNSELENENVATMMALTNIYETFAIPMVINETSTINLSDGKDGNKVNGMSVSPMGMIYSKLIKKGYKTIEQIPANLQAEVKYILKEDK